MIMPHRLIKDYFIIACPVYKDFFQIISQAFVRFCRRHSSLNFAVPPRMSETVLLTDTIKDAKRLKKICLLLLDINENIS